MSFTQPRQLIAAGLIATVLGYLAVRLGYSGLPSLPTFSGATLLLIAGINLVFAFGMRPRIQRKEGTEPVDALTAGRAVALAKASSLAGAIMGGIWIALLVYLLPVSQDIEAVQSDTITSVIGLVSAVALIAAGLWLEHCLRNPDEPDEPRDED